jgi:hypothetical protein
MKLEDAFGRIIPIPAEYGWSVGYSSFVNRRLLTEL